MAPELWVLFLVALGHMQWPNLTGKAHERVPLWQDSTVCDVKQFAI